VLLAIAVGGTLQGVAGAVLILPIVAAYPIVERIWLRDELPRDTIARHGRAPRGLLDQFHFVVQQMHCAT
jgi:hypothetical protein